jgi:hypothetical protein
MFPLRCRSPEILREMKLGILKLLTTTGLIPESFPSLRFLVFLIATSDPSHSVVSAGEDGIRRHVKVDFEDGVLISELYQLYQGTSSSPVADRLWRAPGNIQLKSKVLPYLLKSVAACNLMPNCLQVAFDCIYEENTTAKLMSFGMSFVQWMAKMVSFTFLL